MNATGELEDWRRCVDGDPEAFGRVFDRHRDRVYRHACRLVETRTDAEDVLATAFLELWRRRSAARVVDDSVLPWLLTTTTNVALNQRRSTRRYRALLARIPRGTERGPDASTEALRSVELDVDPRLLAELRELPPIDRRLVVLVALEGFPLKSAAEVLGLRESAARSRWQRVRRRLAAVMEPDGGLLPDPAGGRS